MDARSIFRFVAEIRSDTDDLVTLVIPYKGMQVAVDSVTSDLHTTLAAGALSARRVATLQATLDLLAGYDACPENGLIVYVGMGVNSTGFQVRIAFEPDSSVDHSLYLSGKRFYGSSASC